jgi:hypothetical protein
VQKSGADAMTDEPQQTTPGPILSSIEAQLFVANIKSSCDFYTNKLGFAVEFIYGDPPYYGQVVRDNARLNLRLVFEPVFAGDVRSANICSPLPSRLPPRTKSNNCF